VSGAFLEMSEEFEIDSNALSISGIILSDAFLMAELETASVTLLPIVLFVLMISISLLFIILFLIQLPGTTVCLKTNCLYPANPNPLQGRRDFVNAHLRHNFFFAVSR
jgi:hypothetical protein